MKFHVLSLLFIVRHRNQPTYLDRSRRRSPRRETLRLGTQVSLGGTDKCLKGKKLLSLCYWCSRHTGGPHALSYLLRRLWAHLCGAPEPAFWSISSRLIVILWHVLLRVNVWIVSAAELGCSNGDSSMEMKERREGSSAIFKPRGGVATGFSNLWLSFLAPSLSSSITDSDWP